MADLHSETIGDRPGTELPPPKEQVGALAWTRANLFNGPFNSALTLVALLLLALYVPPLLNWLIFDAHFAGSSRSACTTEDNVITGGACWVFVKARFAQFMYGFYPIEERWRVDLAGLILLLWALPVFVERVPARVRQVLGFGLLLVYPFVAYVLLYGGMFGLVEVETTRWGGLMLTLVIALSGIAASLPLGILLALGRRADDLPVIKAFCVVVIELFRGIPLIVWLFTASVVFALMLPEGMNLDKLLRAIVFVMLFASAYMAEVVRGGLQAIPKGQYEAAAALGLGYWKTTAFVILPQALKMVIPGIVNTFIGLFKDTSLVLIIGLFDLLGIVQAATKDPEWLGFATEGYLFAAFGFWIFCFFMSRYSQHVERKLDTGHKT